MSVDIVSLCNRFAAVEQEVSYIQRKRKEEAENAVRALQAITDEEVELLKKCAPEFEQIRSYTVDDLLHDANGELAQTQRVYGQLTDMLDRWLKHCEDSLC